jgi:hypothetical protein
MRARRVPGDSVSVRFPSTTPLSVRKATVTLRGGGGRDSRPLATASSFWVFRAVFLVLSLFFFYRGVALVGLQLSDTELQATKVVFRALELSHGGLPADSGLIGSLGLLRGGCPLAQARAFEPTPGGGAITFDSPVTFDGYFFTTSAYPADRDPVRWLLDASTDNGSTWLVVGASGWAANTEGGLVYYPQLPFDTPLARLHRVETDYRWVWPRRVLFFSGGFEWAVGLLLSLLAGILGRGELVSRIFVATIAVGVLLVFTSAVGYHALGDTRSAVGTWIYLSSQVTLLIGIAFYESQIMLVFLAYSVLNMVAAIIRHLAIYKGGWLPALAAIASSPAPETLCFAALVFFFRQHSFIRARRLIQADKRIYDDIWESVLKAPGAQTSLDELQQLVMELSKAVSQAKALNERGCSVRQCVCIPVWDKKPLCPASPTEDLEQTGGEGSSSDRDRDDCSRASGPGSSFQPVRSLDQLFVQAQCVHPLLLDRVKAWATVSRGMFPLVGKGGYVEYSEAIKTAESFSKLRFATIKSVSRSIEKVVRVYGQVSSDFVVSVPLCLNIGHSKKRTLATSLR